MKKVLIVTMVALLLVTGCKKVPQLKNGEDKVAGLKEGAISVDELYDEMKSQYALTVLINMVDEKILDKKYETSDEEKDYIELQKDNDLTLYSIYYSETYQTYELYLQARYNYDSADQLDDYFKTEYRKTLATKDYAKSLVTDSQVEDYYKNEYAPEIEASHILITADYASDATEEEKAAAELKALNTAKEVIEKLNKGGDFAELAKEYSKDGSASKGGALGKFGHGDMVEEFETAAYKLKVNEYTKEPVKTKYGYHVILKTKEYEKKALDEVKNDIIDTLADRLVESEANISDKAMIKLREDSGLDIQDSELKAQYENYTYNFE